MEVDDFYKIVNQTDADYTDNLFPAGSSALYFPDGGINELGSVVASNPHPVYWHRVSVNPNMADKTLFGQNYITPADIIQGSYIGNCWFMASITAMAEYEGRIENMFLNKEKSASGIYAV